MDLLIEITVSDRCNKNCSYCFEKRAKSQEDAFDRWKPYILKTCEDVAAGKVQGVDGIQLTFWGGEPFLRCDRMLDLIESTSGYGFVSYNVYTNGTLAGQTREFVQDPRYKAVSGRFSAQISYDGSPCNEKRRGYGFGDIRGQARTLADSGADLSFKATLCYEDIQEFPRLWDSYADLAGEWPGIRYSPTLDSFGKPGCSLEEWSEIVKSLCRREYAFYGKNGRFLMSWFDDLEPRRCRLSNRVFLHTDGIQYVCHGCPYSGDLRLRTGSLADGRLIFAGENRRRPRSRCGATYCVYCNAAGMPEGRLEDSWNAGCGRGSSLCRMYGIFGWYRRALVYGIIKGK